MQSKFKLLILITAALGALAVILGAFGSHFLAERLSEKSALLYRIYRIKGLFYVGLYFMIGIFLFSGSLYFLSLQSLMGITIPKFVGLVTPIGGLALLGAWASMFLTVLNIKTN